MDIDCGDQVHPHLDGSICSAANSTKLGGSAPGRRSVVIRRETPGVTSNSNVELAPMEATISFELPLGRHAPLGWVQHSESIRVIHSHVYAARRRNLENCGST